MPLTKAINRANLVKVAVMVNGRFGQYQSHRWKNPNAAFDILKQDMRRQGIQNPEATEFVEKRTGKSVREEDILKQYSKTNKKETIQEYVQREYMVKETQPNARYSTTSETVGETEKFIKMSRWLYLTLKEEYVDDDKYKNDNGEKIAAIALRVKPTDIIKETPKAYQVNLTVVYKDRTVGVIQVWLAKSQVKEVEIPVKPKNHVPPNEMPKPTESTIPETPEVPTKPVELAVGTQVSESLFSDGKIHLYKRGNNGRVWLAKIVGESKKYRFERSFITLNELGKHNSEADLTEGVVYNWYDGKHQYFGYVQGGKLYTIDAEDVLIRVLNPPKPPKEIEEALDNGKDTTIIEDPKNPGVYWRRRPYKPQRESEGDKTYPPTNDYPIVKTGIEFVKKMQALKHLNLDNFARTTMDLLNVKIPLNVKLDLEPGLIGATHLNYLGIPSHIELVRKGPPSRVKATAIHEALHGVLGTFRLNTEMEEAIVTLATASGISQIEGKEAFNHALAPPYMKFTIPVMAYLKSMPEFKDARTPSEIANKLFSGITELPSRRKEYFDNYENIDENNQHWEGDFGDWNRRLHELGMSKVSNVRNIPEEYYNRYLPKDKALLGFQLAKYSKKAKDALDAILEDAPEAKNRSNNDLEYLVTMLESGGITLAQAMNSPYWIDAASLLLFFIMEEEGVDEVIID